MLTIPEEIKELLHRDHWYKNIRIHFPNGERSDICNDLIVKDTVGFKESLCSQNELKFGLCEAPIFECETVGVGNIKGAKIEVYCEVGCASSVSGAEWRADIQRYVYPIPYGSFIVDSCKREADMTHRKIVAYGGSAVNGWKPINFEQNKKTFDIDTYNPNLGYFLGGNNIPLIETVCDKTPLSVSTLHRLRRDFTFTTGEYPHQTQWDFSIYIDISGIGKRWNSTADQRQYLYKIQHEYYDNTSLNDSLLNDAIDYIQDGFSALSADQKEQLLAPIRYYASLVNYIIYQESIDGGGNRYSTKTWNADANLIFYFYPFQDGWVGTDVQELVLPSDGVLTVAYSINHQSRPAKTWTFKGNSANVAGYELAYKSEYSILNTFMLSFSMRDSYVQYGKTIYLHPVFTDCDVQKMAEALTELLGLFFTWTRDGEGKVISIKRQFGLLPDDNLYPDSQQYPQRVTGGRLLPQDYQSCWYEEEYTSPYGAIYCEYKDLDNADSSHTLYLPGYDEDSDTDTYQVYDISNNELIKSYNWTSSDIDTICGWIAEAIENVSYMPVEFVGRGLPYVEAGDTFEILTKANDSITTIVLDRTLTGEQTLTDSYKSV